MVEIHDKAETAFHDKERAERAMWVFRLIFVCLLVMSFGGFVVYLETERAAMRHQVLLWENLKKQFENQRTKVRFEKNRVLQNRIHGPSILDYLGTEKEQVRQWVQ